MADTTTTRRQTTTQRRTAASASSKRRQAATTRRSTAGKKAAATRARNTASAQVEAEARGLQGTIRQAQTLTGRVVLVQAGAVLTARDRIAELTSTYSSRATAERQLRAGQRRISRELRKLERRGVKGRNSVERDVKRTSTRVERELRRRRTSVTRRVSQGDAVPSDIRTRSRGGEARIDLVTAQVENAVQTGVTAAEKLVAQVTDRVLA